jgi:hypothetical protein
VNDYGQYMSDEYSRDHDDVAARELATDRALRNMDKLTGAARLQYVLDLIRKGGMKDDDIADVLSQGAYAGKDAWQSVSEAFDEGAWQEYVS